MKKYKQYYYTIKKVGSAARNNSHQITLYSWTIRNKNGEPLYSTMVEFNDKDDCIQDAIDHIDEHFY